MHRSLLPAFALLAACTPQNASIVQGDYTAWLAATNSLTVARGDVLFDADGAPLLDVEDAKPGSAGGYRSYKVLDCRTFESAENDKQNEALRIQGREKICPGDPGAKSIDQEIWLLQNGYHTVNDAFEPWRGEALITSEGDLQVAFHQRLPSGEDFRFEFAINPNFEPKQCVLDDDGAGSHWEDVDGNWLEHWSKGLPDGSRRYFLNSNASQFDPKDPEGGATRPQWFLPLRWRAGYAAGKFADDRFSVRSTRYGDPWAYLAAESAGINDVGIDAESLWTCGKESPRCNLDEQRARARAAIEDVYSELTIAGVPDSGDISVKPVFEDNDWRADDDRDGGLDGWYGANYSWVTFDAGSELDVGGDATGEFSIFFDGTDSGSRFYVRGKFSLEGIKKDHWVSPDLRDVEDLLPDSQPACGGTDDATAE